MSGHDPGPGQRTADRNSGPGEATSVRKKVGETTSVLTLNLIWVSERPTTATCPGPLVPSPEGRLQGE